MTTPSPKDFPFPTADDHEAKQDTVPVDQEPSEAAIDQGVAESFPASDPVSVSITKIERVDEDADEGGSDGGERAGPT